MSDKMLMENWRKFLAEARRDPDSGVVTDISTAARRAQQVAQARGRPRHSQETQDRADAELDAMGALMDAREECEGDYSTYENCITNGGTEHECSDLEEQAEDECIERAEAKYGGIGRDDTKPRPEEKVPIGNAPTIGEFLNFMEELQSKIRDTRGIEAGVKTAIAATPFVSTIATGVEAGSDAYDIITKYNSAEPIMRTQYAKNPYLAWIAFDPIYKKLFKGEVFDNFLSIFVSDLRRLPGDSVMPDIDRVFEAWLANPKNGYGITLDGAKHAEDEETEGWELVRGKYVRITYE